jgi:hypothetical protein
MENYGEDKEIYITTNDDYTHVILLNFSTPNNIMVSKEKVIGLAFEPPSFLLGKNTKYIEYAIQNISKFFIGSTEDLPPPFLSQYSFMWHCTVPRAVSQKTKAISIMVSNKQETEGHIYRHTLVKEILKTNLEIDIYGRGCKFYSGDNRLKGEYTEEEPYASYQFHICIENFKTPCYTSEKYTNSILHGATPIYWGATNIDEMFPNITITLSGDVEKDMHLLSNILINPRQYTKQIMQEEIRSKINILKNLDNIFS